MRKTRVLSAILALAMVFSTFSIAVFAEGDAKSAAKVGVGYVTQTEVLTTVWGETANTDPERSLSIELYKDEIKMATVVLNDIDNIYEAQTSNLTWHFVVDGVDKDPYWTTTWEVGYPNAKSQPNKVVMYIDGAKVDEDKVNMDIPDNLKPVEWSKLNCFAAARVGDVYYATLQEAFDALAENGGTLEFLKDIDATDYVTPVTLTKGGTIDGKGYTITGLTMPLVKTVSADTKFNDVKIDSANIHFAEYNDCANGLGVAAYVCYLNSEEPKITFENCELTNSKIIVNDDVKDGVGNEPRSAGIIAYYDHGAVDVVGGKVENCEIKALNGVGAITAWTNKPLTIVDTVIRNNIITSTEDRGGRDKDIMIAGTIMGTATVSSVNINATVENNTTTQNIDGVQTDITTIYGRNLKNNPATITIAGGKYDDEPIVVSDFEKYAVGAVGHKSGDKFIVHAKADKVEAKAPTCTDAGNVEYYSCPCGKYFSSKDYTEITFDEVAIKAVGHNKEKVATVEPTCTKQGYTTYKCSECNNSFVEDYKSAPGHSYEVSETTDATADKDGEKKYTCTVKDCNASYTVVIPKLGHSFSSKTVEATCTEQGYTEYTCTTCKPGTHTYRDDYVNATGHAFSHKTVEPTCTAKGYTQHKCEKCNYSFRNNVTEMISHSYEIVETIAATPDKDGKKKFVCKAEGCNDSYEEGIPKLGHDFISTTTEPTCTEQGYTEYTCTTCGEGTHTYKANYVSAKGHTWVDGETVEADCKKTGYTNFECSDCGATKKDSFTEMSDHSFDNETHLCTVCNVKDVNYIEEELKAAVETLSAVPQNLNYKDTDELKSDMKNMAETTVLTEKEIESEIYDIQLKTDTAVFGANNFPEEGHIFKIEIPNDAPKDANFIVCHMITESYDGKTAGDIEILDSWVEDGYICFRTNSTSPILVSWEKAEEVSETPTTGGSGGALTLYTVDFESNGGSEVKSVSARRGNTIKEPTAPTKAGYTFAGWYKDSELTAEFNFASTTIIKDITLYAKWIKNGEETDAPEEVKTIFTDVKANDWYFDAVKFVADNKLMNGVTETEFAPDAQLTRAMLVTILYRNEGEPEIAENTKFTDIKKGFYYVNAVAWAKANGIVNGVTETEFAPDTNITREQIAAIIYRYAQHKGMDAVNMAENLGAFTDSNEASEYAVSALNWAVGCGLINGKTETTLNPQDNATRAEIATILKRFIESNK